MRILHTKGKMSRWFEFTLFSTARTARTVCVKETTIAAFLPAAQEGTLIYTSNSDLSYFHVTSTYEEILKVLTLEERD